MYLIPNEKYLKYVSDCVSEFVAGDVDLRFKVINHILNMWPKDERKISLAKEIRTHILEIMKVLEQPQEDPVTSPRQSGTRSKSEPRPEGVHKKNSSSVGVRPGDKASSLTLALPQKFRRWSEGIRCDSEINSWSSQEPPKSASREEDVGRRKSRTRGDTAADTEEGSAEDRGSGRGEKDAQQVADGGLPKKRPIKACCNNT